MDKEATIKEVQEYCSRDLTKEKYTDILLRHRKYKKVREDLLEGKDRIRVAVLGSKSIQFFVSVFEMEAFAKGIYTDIYEGEYDGILSDIMDEGSALYAFKPDFVILLTHHTDIKVYPKPLASKEEIEEWLSSQTAFYKDLYTKLSKTGCTVLQSLFVSPIKRQYDQLEESLPYSARNCINMLNQRLCSEKPDFVHYIDLNYVAEYVGKSLWFDERNYYLNKAGFSYEYLPLAAQRFVSRIESLSGRTRKCVVLDLDNTLWGGVVGDLGYDGINLNPNDAIGESYLAFQEYLLKLKQRGIILAVCSKNDDDIAKEAFEKNPFMKIALNDIACFKANWDDKASNIRAIAEELNIGRDSLVFVDDNPAERQIVKQFVPEVTVIDLPEDPALYVRALNEAMCFDWPAITKEDISRVDSYRDNAKRNALLASGIDYDDYLRSLEMSGKASTVTDKEIERFVQLTNKSNQFNLRTQRITEAQVRQFEEGGSAACIAVRLSDCFSDYGIIGCVILEKQGSDCFIYNWLQSCRVLKRGVEDFTLNALVKEAKKLGCTRLIGEYIQSPKNRMVENFYTEKGFTALGDNRYALELDTYTDRENHIRETE
ncbi:MAG: HAD family hydrolase [Firmicutes bacterium]|nr:HAD family hydrolase [Bacillota bacterium]